MWLKRRLPTTASAAGRSIEFVPVVNMLNVDKIISLPKEMLAHLSPHEWLESAWNAAVENIIRDKTKIVKIERGIWRIQCYSMQAVAQLQAPGKIISRLHQLHTIRELPELRGFMALPPIGVGTPMQMLKSLPIENMPANLWTKFAWRLAVDPETAQSSSVIGISKGTWQIRCDSQHAWDFLQIPEPTLGMLRWLSHFKPLPEAKALALRLGQISLPQATPQKEQDVTDDPDIPMSITDPNLRCMLARLRPK